MTTAPMSGPALTPAARIGRILVLPVALGAAAVVISGLLGHVSIGLLIAVGLALGAVNGVLAERAGSRLTSTDDRSVVVGGSLRRLGLITIVAFAVAVLARPDGWTVLVGLAVYQLLSLAAALGAAAKEARTG
ncbi:MAG: hypothetical protein QOE99_2566 [Actinomycetota bacterium]|nr:hypothetical protein [Actinomycetota bacterium]